MVLNLNLQDIKYVLLRLQKAIARVEQGMKVDVLMSNYNEHENVAMTGAGHGRFPDRGWGLCP